ncbi:hypothetical protein QTP88_016175 [Uroleucon formosanum]
MDAVVYLLKLMVIAETLDGDGNAMVKCVWPPRTCHVTSDLLKEALESSNNWNTYKIKLYENVKEHVTLSEESASEIDYQHNIQNKNKRLYGQSSVMIHEDSDTSSEEGCIKNGQKDYSDVSFESNLADWFHYATTRHKRSL